MGIAELFLIALSLSMDAFAVAICKGLSIKKLSFSHAATIGIYFGAFQAIMPTAGFFLGSAFREYMQSFDNYIAFALLTFIGVNMLRDAVNGEDSSLDDRLDPKIMLLLAIATSIDALAAGVSFAFLEVEIFFAAVFIGAITFALSAIGAFVGYKTGSRFKTRAQIAGAAILILLGVKMLVEQFL